MCQGAVNIIKFPKYIIGEWQGKYRAICLWMLGRQSFAIFVRLPLFGIHKGNNGAFINVCACTGSFGGGRAGREWFNGEPFQIANQPSRQSGIKDCQAGKVVGNLTKDCQPGKVGCATTKLWAIAQNPLTRMPYSSSSVLCHKKAGSDFFFMPEAPIDRWAAKF